MLITILNILNFYWYIPTSLILNFLQSSGKKKRVKNSKDLKKLFYSTQNLLQTYLSTPISYRELNIKNLYIFDFYLKGRNKNHFNVPYFHSLILSINISIFKALRIGSS